jgi:cyclic pyranopterin monophosphate synthase
MSRLSHLDDAGRPRMVDVSDKPSTARYARATGAVRTDAATLNLVLADRIEKGSVVQVAELAGIMAAKRTSDLIPLCHPLPLSSVNVRIESDATLPGLRVFAECRTTDRTGVEMEALCAVSVACLTIYDMLKSATRNLAITEIVLIEKRGGASGNWSSGE